MKLNHLKHVTKSEATKITPELALQLLGNNKCTKKINQSDVNRIAKDMTDGQYEFNGSSIILNAKGELIDGQARLFACVQSKKSFYSFIVKGISKKAEKTISFGLPRNTAQWLSERGYQHPTLLANTARIIYLLESENNLDSIILCKPVKVSYTDIVKTIENHPKLVESINYIASCRKQLIVRQSLSLLIAMDYITRIQDGVELANSFIEHFNGNLINTMNMGTICRNQITSDIIHKGSMIDSVTEHKLLLNAYNLHTSNRIVKKITTTDNSDFDFHLIV